jgi:hypothetical protein
MTPFVRLLLIEWYVTAKLTYPRPADEVVSYGAWHNRIRGLLGQPADYLCEGGCPGKAQAWATMHDRGWQARPQGYKIFWDAVPLCWRCHQQYDGTDEIRRQSLEKGRRQPHTPERSAKHSAGMKRRWAEHPETWAGKKGRPEPPLPC